MSLSKLIIILSLVFNGSHSLAQWSGDVDGALTKIRNLAITSYNNKDIEPLMSTWHEKGVISGHIGPKADVISGAKAIRASYLADFTDAHFSKIAMHSEDTQFINGLYIDSGTLTFLEPDGSKGLTGCYVMIFIKEGGAIKAIKEFSYPFCMLQRHEPGVK